LSSHESYAIGLIDLVDSTRYYREGGDPLGKEAKRRHNEISSHIFEQFHQEIEPPKGDGFLFWGKDPIQSCLAAIEVIKRIKTEVIQHSTENRRYNMATKIVMTKGLIKTKEDEKDLTHGQAAHKCQRIMDAAWQKHHTVLIDSQVFDEIKGHLSDTDIIYSGPYLLQVEEFGEIEVYQIADKELGLIVDPTRTKLHDKIKTEVKKQVKEQLEERLKITKINIEKSTKVKLVAMSIAIALLTSSLVLVLTVYPNSNSNSIYQNEIEFTALMIQEESKNAAIMIYETSKNDLMREHLLTTYTENYPIMIPENNFEEKSRIDLVKTVVDGMDVLYYLFVVPPETWSETLQCRLYVIYPVGALIPGEAPEFLQQRDWCENKANFEMYLSSAYYSRGQKEIVTTMIVPIWDDDLQKVGYLAGAINFNKIIKESLEQSKMSDFGYVLVDHDNCIVASKYKNDSTIGDIVHFRELYTFNSGTIDLAPADVNCKNADWILNPQGQIQMTFDEHSKFNGWNYEMIYLNQPEITKPDIDTNNFLENWKLIVLQPA
jgi:hypothetical protein